MHRVPKAFARRIFGGLYKIEGRNRSLGRDVSPLNFNNNRETSKRRVRRLIRPNQRRQSMFPIVQPPPPQKPQNPVTFPPIPPNLVPLLNQSLANPPRLRPTSSPPLPIPAHPSIRRLPLVPRPNRLLRPARGHAPRLKIVNYKLHTGNTLHS
jgi:hypothetical protein